MAEKTGAGGKPQDFNESDGRYTDGNAANVSYSELVKSARANFKSAVDSIDEDPLLPNNGIPDAILERCKQFSDEEIRKSSGWLSGIGKEDEVLKAIIKAQGFDSKPKVVKSDEIEELVNNGCLGFVRGMKVDYGAEQYKTGDMYVGRGVHGSGVYVACYSDLQEKNQAVNTANRYATDRNTDKQGSIINGVISKDAKIISKSQLNKIREELLSQWDDKLKMCFANNGKLAAALGYDVIDCETDSYFIVLNRGKTIVGE